MAAVVHPSNPVSNVSYEQLNAILKGEIKNWKNLGGPDKPIIIIARRGNESGVGVMVRLIIMENADFDYPKKAIFLQSSRLVEQLLERTPNGVCYHWDFKCSKTEIKDSGY